jgi:hypothetical protein
MRSPVRFLPVRHNVVGLEDFLARVQSEAWLDRTEMALGRRMARLVLIETSGNQDFIFSTNKLKQNIGASELIHRIGTRFVIEAVAKEVPAYEALLAGDMPAADYVKQLDRLATENLFGEGAPVEVLVATSGKAVLLVDTVERGERIIGRVTLQALKAAPGAVVRGFVDKGKDPEDEKKAEIDLDHASRADAHARMKHVHEAVNRLRLDLPAPEARFPVLPITALCPTSGLPVERRVLHLRTDERPERVEEFSRPAYRKHAVAQEGWERVRKALEGAGGERLARNVNDLEKLDLAWFGVLHADGNGFGKVFFRLADHMPVNEPDTARAYCTFYRNLSLALELAGLTALRTATAWLDTTLDAERRARDPQEKPRSLPLMPLVFGGDDLTVICDGSRAVAFAAEYLDAFETATDAETIDGFRSVLPVLVDPETKARKPGFGGAAGVAIVKPHHPFHRAYALAEDLVRSAKKTKTLLGDAASSIDFQVVYDDAANSLAGLRAGWRIVESGASGNGRACAEAWLHARPYVVSAEERFAAADASGQAWARRHHLRLLREATHTLKRPGATEPAVADGGAEEAGAEERGLPRSQQHALRGALFEGGDIAKARLGLVRHRYKAVEWQIFGDETKPKDDVDSLFFEETMKGDCVQRTRFMDALELIDIGENLTDHPASAAAPEPAR